MTKKIWGDYKLLPLIEKYTKGDDLVLDGMLLPYDIQATEAQTMMLNELGIISASDVVKLKTVLGEILKQTQSKKFSIPTVYEDGHSYLEAKLIERCGSVGKKIHYLRSRNDQSLVMIRLYMKDQLSAIVGLSHSVADALLAKGEQFEGLIMPGHTHMQKAMPTTTTTWICSYADAIHDTLLNIESVIKAIDQNPLGSGAGFGFIGQDVQPNTAITTELLGFAKAQINPMYCGMSRGNFELMLLQAIQPLMLIASQFASDLLLYTMSEFGYFSLPQHFTTGSSIMPQKHNYDCLEIIRGKESIFWGYVEQIHGIVAGKTSGYQRDLQLTKRPLVEAMQIACETLSVWAIVSDNIQADVGNIQKALTPELYATKKANDLVSMGLSFRDAYTLIKNEMEK